MNRNKQISRKQSGFTLVEIAIVLVIIGLLLGGVLKGQEMIENARIKSVVGDMSGVAAAYNSYVDRFRAIPGDETTAVMTARGWTGAPAGGDGNGVLVIDPADTFANTGEQAALWRALRGSGMAAGNPAAGPGAANLPKAGTGGFVGVAMGAYAMAGPSVCVSGLSTKQASGVDASIDGTLPANNTGTARGNNGVAPLPPTLVAPGAVAYNETTIVNPWTMCRRM